MRSNESNLGGLLSLKVTLYVVIGAEGSRAIWSIAPEIDYAYWLDGAFRAEVEREALAFERRECGEGETGIGRGTGAGAGEGTGTGRETGTGGGTGRETEDRNRKGDRNRNRDRD